MSGTICMIVLALAAQATAMRPIAEPREKPPVTSAVPEQPHIKVLPQQVALVMLGTYSLDKPLGTGEREISLSIVDDQLRLRVGEAERLMIYERLGTEASGGVKTADVYGFTVAGMPGVMMQVNMLDNRVQYLVIFDDLAKPPVAATGKPRRR